MRALIVIAPIASQRHRVLAPMDSTDKHRHPMQRIAITGL
jgi:hypothetical protein